MKTLGPGEGTLARKEFAEPSRINSNLPKIGEWFHVTWDDRYEWDIKEKPDAKEIRTELMCVEHVASNHVRFARFGATDDHSSRDTDSWSLRVGLDDLLKQTTPEPEWRAIIEKRMEEVREEMAQQTRLLYEAGQKANALPANDSTFTPTAENPLALSIRVSDPAVQKRNLVALKERIPKVIKKVEALAKEQAALAKCLMLPELSNLYAMKKRLDVVEDKIFTLEVYAGLQEEVKQIGDGNPAAPDTKITVRQSLLFMDEEALIDWQTGGMDFRNLDDFDKWVAKPEHLNHVLPEPRGIVAFRVRRNRKDYGEVRSILEALVQMRWHAENMQTYLLIRNGEKVYRIASGVDFSPRLIPLKDEFDDAFVKKAAFSSDRAELIGPAHFDYDQQREEIGNRLKHYNRVVVLIQGLLDRSEVFHPHTEINLAEEGDIHGWLNLVRDEEGGLGAGSLSETWEDYRKSRAEWIKKGDWIWSDYWDGRKRPESWKGVKDRPSIIQVARVRLGNKGDIVPRRVSGYGRSYHVETEGRDAEQCVGVPGVEIEWDGGTYTIYPRDRWRGSYEKHYKGRMWIPLSEVVNASEYQLGDYKKFLCDRTQKGAYLDWAPALLSIEDWKRTKTVDAGDVA